MPSEDTIQLTRRRASRISSEDYVEELACWPCLICLDRSVLRRVSVGRQILQSGNCGRQAGYRHHRHAIAMLGRLVAPVLRNQAAGEGSDRTGTTCLTLIVCPAMRISQSLIQDEFLEIPPFRCYHLRDWPNRIDKRDKRNEEREHAPIVVPLLLRPMTLPHFSSCCSTGRMQLVMMLHLTSISK